MRGAGLYKIMNLCQQKTTHFLVMQDKEKILVVESVIQRQEWSDRFGKLTGSKETECRPELRVSCVIL